MLGVEVQELDVEGARVRYRRFPAPGCPPLILVHGGGGHGGWWLEVIPCLLGRYDLVVPDLGGNGDSEHRVTYSPEIWAQEIAAIVCEEFDGPINYVGHSMGGLVGIYVASLYPELVQRMVLIDSMLREPTGDGLQPRGRERRPTPEYPSEDAALARFRLRPEGTVADPALLEAVGRMAIKKVGDSWTWKFDHKASQRFIDRQLDEQLALVKCPLGFVYGENSAVASAENVDYLRRRVGRPVPAIEIPEAYHHVPLDAPEECAAAVEQLLAKLGLAQGASGEDRSPVA